MADGYAVKELLKVAAILYNASKSNVEQSLDMQEDTIPSFNFDLSSKVIAYTKGQFKSILNFN